MTLNEAKLIMQETVEKSKEKFSSMVLSLNTVTEFTDEVFEVTKDKDSAQNISVSLIISADSFSECNEYCISLTANIKKGKVNEKILNKNIRQYNKIIENTVSQLSESEDKISVLKRLGEEGNREFEKLIENLDKIKKRNKIILVITVILAIIGFGIILIGPFLI